MYYKIDVLRRNQLRIELGIICEEKVSGKVDMEQINIFYISNPTPFDIPE